MSFLVITALINFVSCFVLFWIVWAKCPRRNVAYAYSTMLATVSIWAFFYIFWQRASSAETALFPFRMLTLATIWINQAFLLFTFTFLGLTPFRKRFFLIAIGFNLLFTAQNFLGVFYPLPLVLNEGYGYWPQANLWCAFYITFWHLELVVGFSAMVFNLKRAQGLQKEQMKYMITAFTIAYFGGVLNWPMWYQINIPPYFNWFVCLYLTFVAYAIIKDKLINLTIIIRRTLVYSAVTASLAVLYVSLILLVAHLFESFTGGRTLWIAITVAAFTTIVFHPLRIQIQETVDKRFFRSRSEREKNLVSFAQEMTSEDKHTTMANAFIRAVQHSFHPKSHLLYLQSTDQKTLVPYGPEATGFPILQKQSNLVSYIAEQLEPITLADSLYREEVKVYLAESQIEFPTAVLVGLVSQKDLLGFILLSEKKSDEPYTDEDRVLLRLIATQAALGFERPKLRNEITGSFVHEIKMPLANISLPAELTFLDMDDIESGRKEISEVLPKIRRRMKYIMEQALLAGSRVDAVRQIASIREESEKQTVDVRKTIERSLAQLDELIKSGRVQVKYRPADNPIQVHANPYQLEIVFTNLMKNAVEEMTKDAFPRKRELSISIENGEKQIEITIVDTGGGIPHDVLSEVFKSHYSTKGNKGSGMGLFLCKQIIEAHSGHISVLSDIGQSTTFKVTIPRATQ